MNRTSYFESLVNQFYEDNLIINCIKDNIKVKDYIIHNFLTEKRGGAKYSIYNYYFNLEDIKEIRLNKEGVEIYL